MPLVHPPSKKPTSQSVWVPFTVLIATLLLIGLYSARALSAPNLIVGTWVEKAGEVWEIGADGSIKTTNANYPNRSFRWNSKRAIHLFHEAKQQSPVGPFEVSVDSQTLRLNPLYVHRPSWNSFVLLFHRVSEPPGKTVPVIVAIIGVVGIAAFLWLLQRRRNARSND